MVKYDETKSQFTFYMRNGHVDFVTEYEMEESVTLFTGELTYAEATDIMWALRCLDRRLRLLQSGKERKSGELYMAPLRTRPPTV
jgi:hypothetical protein